LQTAIFTRTIEKGVVINVLEEGKGKRRQERGGKGRRWRVRATGRAEREGGK